MENVCRFVPLVQWPFILRPLDNTHLKLIFEMLVQRILNVTYVYKHKKYRFSSLDFVAAEFGASKVQNSTREIRIVEGT